MSEFIILWESQKEEQCENTITENKITKRCLKNIDHQGQCRFTQ